MVAEPYQGEAHRAEHGERLGGVIAPANEHLHQVALLRQEILGFAEVPARLVEIVTWNTHAAMILLRAPRATLGDRLGWSLGRELFAKRKASRAEGIRSDAPAVYRGTERRAGVAAGASRNTCLQSALKLR